MRVKKGALVARERTWKKNNGDVVVAKEDLDIVDAPSITSVT